MKGKINRYSKDISLKKNLWEEEKKKQQFFFFMVFYISHKSDVKIFFK